LSVKHRSFSERGIVVSFDRPDEVPSAVEIPSTIYFFLPDNVTVTKVPSDSKLSFSASGNLILEIHLSPDASAIEVAWIDDELQNDKEFLLLLAGVAAGVLGGVLTGFLFSSHRWRP
jgi:hypothetical protein